MNLKTTLVLLVFAGAASVVLWPGLIPPEWLGLTPPPTAAGSTWGVLTGELTPEKVRFIAVERNNRPLVQLTGIPATENGKTLVWTLPGNWPTRPGEVEELVGQLTAWGNPRFAPVPIKEPADLKPLGLDPPVVVVTVKADGKEHKLSFGEGTGEQNQADGKEHKLSFGEGTGEQNRFSRPTFVRLDDQPEAVRLAPGLIRVLNRPAEYYQQRRLFPVDRVVQEGTEPGKRTERLAATALEAKGPDGGFALIKGPDGAMLLHEEWGDDHADPEKLKGVLAASPDLWADYFVSDPKKDLAEYGLDKPERTLRVTGTDGKTVALLIGKESPHTETRTVPRPPPPGLPPGVQIPPEVITEKYRYAKLENNDQIFEIRGGKLPEIFVKADELRDATLARFKPEEVKRLEVKRGDFTLVAVKGEGDKWKLEKPIAGDAENARVGEVIAALAGLRASGADVITSKDKKAYDLESPAAVVTLAVEEPKKEDEPAKEPRTIAFELGKDDAATKKLYVKLAGWERINAVDDALLSLVNRPALAYRGRGVLDFTVKDLVQADVKRGEEAFTLKKDDKGVWRLTEPVAAPVDIVKVDRLVGDLGKLNVVEFVSEEPKEEELDAGYGLAKPSLTAALTFADAEKKPPQTLRIGKPRGAVGEYFAKLESAPQVFVIRKEDHDAVDQPSLAYRPLNLWQFPVGDVTSLKIQRGDEPAYRLARAGKDWKVAEPFEAAVAGNLAQSLLEPLSSVRAQRYEAHAAKELAAYGLDKPVLRLTVGGEEKKGGANPVAKEHTLLVGKPTAEGAATRFAKLADDDAVVVIDDKLFGAADRSALDLLDRNLLKLDAKTVTRFQRTGGEVPWSVERKDKAWQVEAAGATFAPDASVLDATLAVWSALRAAKFAAYGAELDLPKYGLDKPAAVLKATVQPAEADAKPVEHTLALGKTVAADSGDRYARLDDGPGVVVLPGAVVAELNRTHLDFVDHSLLEIDPATVTALSRGPAERALELTKKEAGWRLTKPTDYPADEPTVEALVKDLARLRGERVAAYPVKDLKPFGLDAPTAVVTLILGDGEKIVKIGELAGESKESGDRFAVLDGGDKVVVLPGRLVAMLLGTPLKFRDRAVARFGDADKATLERGGRKVAFAQVDGTWKVVNPLDAPAEHSDLDDFVNAVGRLRAAELVADRTEITPADLKKYGLDHPEARWQFQAGDKDVLNLQVGAVDKATGRAYARLADGDVVFLLDPKTTGRVLAEYRRRAVWPALDAAQMDRLAYTTPKGSFVMEKGMSGWQVSGDPDALVYAGAVNETLAALGTLKAARYIVDKDADLKLYGLDSPLMIVRAWTPTGECVLKVGHTEGDSKRYYAMVGDGKHTDVFVLSEADSARIVRETTAFTQAKPKKGP